MEDPLQSMADGDAALQPYLQAAHESSANAATLRALVVKVLSDPEIFAGYDEIKAAATALPNAPDGEKLLRTLDLFSYGTYKDYVDAAPDTYLTLTEAQVWKLRQLSVLTLVQQVCQQKALRLSYETVQRALQLPDHRTTEQILVSCIYARVVTGQLCQKTQCLLLGGSAVAGGSPVRPRDVPLAQVTTMLETIRAFQQRLMETSQDLSSKSHQVQSHVDLHHRFVKTALEHKKKAEESLGNNAGGSSSGLLTGQSRATLEGGSGDAMDLSGSSSARGGQSSNSARRQKRSRGGFTSGIADAAFGRYQS